MAFLPKVSVICQGFQVRERERPDNVARSIVLLVARRPP